MFTEPEAGLQEVWSSYCNNGLMETRPRCKTKIREVGGEPQPNIGRDIKFKPV